MLPRLHRQQHLCFFPLPARPKAKYPWPAIALCVVGKKIPMSFKNILFLNGQRESTSLTVIQVHAHCNYQTFVLTIDTNTFLALCATSNDGARISHACSMNVKLHVNILETEFYFRIKKESVKI